MAPLPVRCDIWKESCLTCGASRNGRVDAGRQDIGDRIQAWRLQELLLRCRLRQSVESRECVALPWVVKSTRLFAVANALKRPTLALGRVVGAEAILARAAEGCRKVLTEGNCGGGSRGLMSDDKRRCWRIRVTALRPGPPPSWIGRIIGSGRLSPGFPAVAVR